MKINDNGIDREMTKEEIAYLTETRNQIKNDLEKQAHFANLNSSALASARIKFAALGLTDSEIEALLGVSRG